MTDTPTKTCPICCEEIKAPAKKCPHCGHWQTKWHTTVYHPGFSMIAIGVPLLALWIGGVIWLEKMFRPQDPIIFVDHIQEIEVLKSEMHFEERGESQTVSTVGVITNKGVLAWEDLLLEVQYYDAAGELIDTANTTTMFDVILPGQEAAFRIRAESGRPKDDYHSHKVFVRSAKPPRSW